MNASPFQSELTRCVDADHAGERLDRYLHRIEPEISRSRFKSLIKEGHVRVSGMQVLEPNRKMTEGERVDVRMPEPEDPVPRGEDIPLDVVYEDDHVIVVDKPAGLVVHPAAGNWTGTLVNALIHHCGDTLSGIGGVRRPGIVHRIDKDTSGLIVVAKTDTAHRGLAEQFAAHGRDGRLERAYLALVWGSPDPRKGKVDAALARSSSNRLKMAVVREGGKHAITRYAVERTLPKGAERPTTSLVRCVLETGRTHQIRVHMAHIGHPLLGDAVYGAGFAASSNRLPRAAAEALQDLDRQALHAARLGFVHPATGETLSFDSPLPAELESLLKLCEAA